MVVKEFEIEEHYDPVADSLYIRIIDDYEYRESIDMGENVILDFDKNHVPVALEIVDASKKLNLNPFSLKRMVEVTMQIRIKEEAIELHATLSVPVHNKQLEKPVDITAINDTDIPQIQTNFATA
ncbi:DUF2283 domain-containing protein [Methanobacterium aggregans]|uniref:DUF2283 domain-containing protein n=1 Tax=Methanobacterium aggregans TaxID=1615586 RepID=UPI001AE76910|nr:DUF2283 domain-containing protein [Methanobacterium aggregans]MBP2047050.1 uncharacterized protein YuzE [Methanobacterium aggregans]